MKLLSVGAHHIVHLLLIGGRSVNGTNSAHERWQITIQGRSGQKFISNYINIISGGGCQY